MEQERPDWLENYMPRVDWHIWLVPVYTVHASGINVPIGVFDTYIESIDKDEWASTLKTDIYDIKVTPIDLSHLQIPTPSRAKGAFSTCIKDGKIESLLFCATETHKEFLNCFVFTREEDARNFYEKEKLWFQILLAEQY
jgi:hypothetical protein